MARYRRRRSRRRVTRRKTRRAPRRYVARKSRGSRSRVNIHTYVRSCEAVISNDRALNTPCVSNDATILASPGTLSGGYAPYLSSDNYAWTMTFAVDKTSQFTELSALYDQYKIANVKLTFEYAAEGGYADVGAVPTPKLAYFRDYDDTTLTTMQELNQREAIVTRRYLHSARPVILNVKPRLKDYIEQSGGVSTAAATYRKAWIDFSNPSVQHYGLKCALLDWPTWNNGTPILTELARPILRVRCEYTIVCRNVR